MDSASELLQVEGQVLGVLASSDDAAGDNTLMGMRVVSGIVTRVVGRRAMAAVSGTGLTRMTLFEVVNVGSVLVMVCW